MNLNNTKAEYDVENPVANPAKTVMTVDINVERRLPRNLYPQFKHKYCVETINSFL